MKTTNISELLNTYRQKTPDAEGLLAYVLRTSRVSLRTWPEQVLQVDQLLAFEALIARRLQGEPFAYLVGFKEFWSLNFRVNSHVLIPRPETELLVEQVLLFGSDQEDPLQVLELGTGSGAISIALAHEKPDWKITALDYSLEALSVAKQNAEILSCPQIEFLRSDWFSEISARIQAYHVIVGNPPYLAATDPHLTEDGLKYEPKTALISGEEGLADINGIIVQAPDYLKVGGRLYLEHGCEQGKAVREIFQRAGFQTVETLQDIAGHERVTYGVRPIC